MSTINAKPIPARIPSIDTEPKFPKTSNYTVYKPQPPQRVQQAVLQVCSNGAFVSRCLRVITRDGQSKNFETITGQDGLTFGITDVASNGGVAEFMKIVEAKVPEIFREAFAGNADNLLNLAWIKANNGGGKGKEANDNGLIKFTWLRKGLDLILTNPKLQAVQLENFRRGKVESSLTTFQAKGYVQEFTLAAMIGIANSRGAGGMREDLEAAIGKVNNSGSVSEAEVAKVLLERYVSADPNPKPNDAELLQALFSNKDIPFESGLGHRAKRVFWLLKIFPPVQKKQFTTLGDFSLLKDGA